MAPGRFGFEESARLTERSPLVTAENRAQLARDWSLHWDRAKPVLLEKTPENLIRGRFLQAVFPAASFVMILRHPIAVSLATQKWSRTSLGSLLKHWAHTHRVLLEDVSYLERLLLVSYERFVAAPQATLDEIWRFVDLPPHPATMRVRADVNGGYFARWERKQEGRITGLYARWLIRRFEDQISELGYSLVDLERADLPSLGAQTQLAPGPSTR